VSRASDGSPLEFRPADRFAQAATAKLHAFGAGPFCRLALPLLPAAPGVYILCSAESVLYVGEAQNIRARWGLSGYATIQPRNCYVGGQSTNCKVNAYVLTASRSGLPLQLWVRECDDRKAVEARLIRALQPPWNRKGL
jgi:hypothetical protein